MNEQQELRLRLFDSALEEGYGIEGALRQGARAELWITGALTSAKVLDLPAAYDGAAPDRLAPPRPDAAGGVAALPAPGSVARAAAPGPDAAPGPEAQTSPAGRAADAGPDPVPAVAREDLSRLQRRILEALETLPATASNGQIAAAVGSTSGSVASSLHKLDQWGHLRREGGRRDMRIVLTGKTAAARPPAPPDEPGEPVEPAATAEPPAAGPAVAPPFENSAVKRPDSQKPENEKAEAIKRRCLKCKAEFVAETPLLRMCRTCRTHPDNQVGAI